MMAIHEPYWPTISVAYCTASGHPPHQAGSECPECKRQRLMVSTPKVIKTPDHDEQVDDG